MLPGFIKELDIHHGLVRGVRRGLVTADEIERPPGLTPGGMFGYIVVNDAGQVRAGGNPPAIGVPVYGWTLNADGTITYDYADPSAEVPVDPFDPWSGAGAPDPTTVYTLTITVVFEGAGGGALDLVITESPTNVVPVNPTGPTGLLGGGTNPTGQYNPPTGGTTTWGLHPGAWYVSGYTSPGSSTNWEMVLPEGTIDEGSGPPLSGLINVKADGTVLTGSGPATSGGFTIVYRVPPT